MIPGQLFKVKAEVHWFLWNKVNRYAESMRTAVPSNTVLEHIGKFYDSVHICCSGFHKWKNIFIGMAHKINCST